MTRIILHTGMSPMQREVRLELPWFWWETRIYPNSDGVLYEQRIDPDLFEHPRRSEYMVTFGRDGDSMVLTDPPAMRITSIEQHHHYGYEEQLLTRVLAGPRYMTVRVVWHEPPGQIQADDGGVLTYEAWRPLQKRTCIPGDYQIETVERDDWRDCPAGPHRWPPERMMPLQWPITPTICDGQPVAPGGAGILPAASELTAQWLRYTAQAEDLYAPVPSETFAAPHQVYGHFCAEHIPILTGRHHRRLEPVEPLPTSGTRAVDGINDDDVIARIDALIDDELDGGEGTRYRRRASNP